MFLTLTPESVAPDVLGSFPLSPRTPGENISGTIHIHVSVLVYWSDLSGFTLDYRYILNFYHL